jgi:GH25 family lysozyme M1 (1,4-beta-N-acetylmuramidase)
VQDTDPLLMHTPALLAARQGAAAARLDGADISHHQYDAGPVNLARTRADPPTTWFATKVTQSTSYLDPTAVASRTAARTHGFRAAGLYHWLSSTTDATRQAAWFLASVGTLRSGEFAMLDAEEAGITAAMCLAWCETVEAVTKRPAAVYTGAFVTGGTIWQSSGLRHSRYGARPFILAAYTTEAKAKALPGVAAYPWSSWQYSSSGPVPGITGRCDMNRVDNWAAYDMASGASTPVPIPAPVPRPAPVGVITPTPEEPEMPKYIVAESKTRGSALMTTTLDEAGNPHYSMVGFNDPQTAEVWGAAYGTKSYSDADYDALAAGAV